MGELEELRTRLDKVVFNCPGCKGIIIQLPETVNLLHIPKGSCNYDDGVRVDLEEIGPELQERLKSALK